MTAVTTYIQCHVVNIGSVIDVIYKKNYTHEHKDNKM